MSVRFFNEQTKFLPEKPQVLQKWVTSVIIDKGYSTGAINYIFCTDEYLLNLNKQYLNHDTYTDIITFDYTINKVINGDIFISIDRVKENAELYKTSFIHELHRVMIHGVLHLCGQKDKTTAENKEMHTQEDLYLHWLEN